MHSNYSNTRNSTSGYVMTKRVGVYSLDDRGRTAAGYRSRLSELQETRVVIADDHPQVRRGIRRLLAYQKDIQIVGEAGDGREALELVDRLEPDVLILDVEMPVLNGIQVARRLHEQDKPVKILVLSAHADLQYILAILDYGVSGYLIKEDVPDILLEAVRGVARGDRGWISQTVADQLNKDDHPVQLTSIEKEILSLVQDDLSDPEIRRKLGIDENAYNLYLYLLSAKLNVSTREELKGRPGSGKRRSGE